MGGRLDPLVLQGEAAWRACARTAGLPVGRQDAQAIGHDLFAARLSAAGGTTRGDDANHLPALQDEERRVALAIYACDEAFAHDTLAPTMTVERDWAARHADRLGGLRAELLRIDEDLERRSSAAGPSGDGRWPPGRATRTNEGPSRRREGPSSLVRVRT